MPHIWSQREIVYLLIFYDCFYINKIQIVYGLCAAHTWTQARLSVPAASVDGYGRLGPGLYALLCQRPLVLGSVEQNRSVQRRGFVPKQICTQHSINCKVSKFTPLTGNSR